jgi:hypothetical protein
VEVRSKEEILRSLDENGRLDGLPFMPQMFQYCGERFRVYKRAHKTCDPIYTGVGRKLSGAVHLELRCDGKAFGGCQSGCLIFWKEAWLKRVADAAASKSFPADMPVSGIWGTDKPHASEEDVWRGTRVRDEQDAEPRHVCQATQILNYTAPLAWWDVRQYVEDYTSGNVTLKQLFKGFVYLSYYHFSLAKRGRLGIPARWLYDKFQQMIGGVPYPRRRGIIPAGEPTPASNLNLQPGELVRVKSYQEILKTLDTVPKNRGMYFDAELVPYCGGVYRVQARVERFLNEKTGAMSTLKTPAIILEGVWCRSRYSNCKMFCPRSIYSWWREIWLERVPEGTIESKSPNAIP